MKFESYFWAPMATSIGIIISITLWFLNRQKKALSYEILCDENLVSIRGLAKNRIKVKFDQQPLHDAKLLVIRIVNTGHIPIAASDFQTRLTITAPEGAQILFADILETLPADLEDRLGNKSNGQTLIENIDETNIYLRPILLNSQDSLTVQILVDKLIGTLSVRAHLQGITAVGKLQRQTWIHTLLIQAGALIMAGAMLTVDPRDITSFGLQELLPCLLIFLLGYIVLFAGLYAPKRWQRKQWSASKMLAPLEQSQASKS